MTYSPAFAAPFRFAAADTEVPGRPEVPGEPLSTVATSGGAAACSGAGAGVAATGSGDGAGAAAGGTETGTGAEVCRARPAETASTGPAARCFGVDTATAAGAETAAVDLGAAMPPVPTSGDGA